MILTNCAACAAPLAHTAPRCVRCQTRYCNQTCQHDHWRRGHNGTADASDIFYAEKLLGENAEKARRILGPKRGSVVDMFRDLPVFRKIAAHIRATRETPPYPSEVRFVVSRRPS